MYLSVSQQFIPLSCPFFKIRTLLSFAFSCSFRELLVLSIQFFTSYIFRCAGLLDFLLVYVYVSFSRRLYLLFLFCLFNPLTGIWNRGGFCFEHFQLTRFVACSRFWSNVRYLLFFGCMGNVRQGSRHPFKALTALENYSLQAFMTFSNIKYEPALSVCSNSASDLTHSFGNSTRIQFPLVYMGRSKWFFITIAHPGLPTTTFNLRFQLSHHIVFWIALPYFSFIWFFVVRFSLGFVLICNFWR